MVFIRISYSQIQIDLYHFLIHLYVEYKNFIQADEEKKSRKSC